MTKEQLSAYKKISELVSEIFFYGNFKVETKAESELEALLISVGLWPTNEDEIINRKYFFASYAGSAYNWQPIATAPKDGTTIEGSYDREHTDTCLAMWSKRPVCMLGNRNGGYPPGWATAPESDCDTNLPLDPPLYWRPYAGSAEEEKEPSSLVLDASETNFDFIIDKAKEFATEYYGSVKEGDVRGQFVFDRIVNGFVAGHFAAIREPEKKDPWISVEYELPDKEMVECDVQNDYWTHQVQILVKSPRGHLFVSTGFMNSNQWYWWNNNKRPISPDFKVIAWSPLLEPPAATNQEGGKDE